MTPPNADSPPQDGPHLPPDSSGPSEIESRQPRNLLLLAAHQIVLRTGWIFKTESVIIPFFVDQVAGAGWIRGCLPVLNRLGQGIPPLFSANYLRSLRVKKRALAVLTALMGVPFLTLSLTWFAVGGQKRAWMPGLFLTLYFAFFVLYGLYLVAFGTVQGKLIRPARRGRLIVLSTFWGAVPATLIAMWLMPVWLESNPLKWGHVFAFVGACFFLSGLVALLVSEPSDGSAKPPGRPLGSLTETIQVLRRDANLRRLVAVAFLFACGLIIFPHYQAFARTKLGDASSHLVVWVVTQNIAVALFGLFVGPLADRRGYRLTLRLLIFGSAVAPVIAIALSQFPVGMSGYLFCLVFVPLGITPLVHRTLLNYALEICEPESHPRYQSIVSLGVTAPFLLSPLAGWLVDLIGFGHVFVSTIVVILLSGILTFRLEEPRHRLAEESSPIDVVPPE